MARLAQILGIAFFILVMGWGAWATLYDHQMHGQNSNLPEVGSPVLPTEVITALPYLGLAILVIGIFAALLTKTKSSSQATSYRRRASDFDEGDPERPKIDDDMIAAAAARYRAEQEAQQLNPTNFQPRSETNGPTTFGRRKTDR
jgi:hypothetical protein